MSHISQTFCKSCHAEIFWVVTKNAKRMPVDYEGDAAGDFWIFHNDRGVGGDVRVPLAIHKKGAQPTDLAKMRAGPRASHFATCPDADQYRGAPK